MRDAIGKAVDEAVAEVVALREEASQTIEETIFWAHFAPLVESANESR